MNIGKEGRRIRWLGRSRRIDERLGREENRRGRGEESIVSDII
jgi:hypothetical protein